MRKNSVHAALKKQLRDLTRHMPSSAQKLIGTSFVNQRIKARSDRLCKMHQPGSLFHAYLKCSQIETIASTSFYSVHYAGLNEALFSYFVTVEVSLTVRLTSSFTCLDLATVWFVLN